MNDNAFMDLGETLAEDFRALANQRKQAAEAELLATNKLLAKTAAIVYLIPVEVRSKLRKIFPAFLDREKMRRRLECLARGRDIHLQIDVEDLNRLGFSNVTDAWETVTAWKNFWRDVVNVIVTKGVLTANGSDIDIRLTMKKTSSEMNAANREELIHWYVMGIESPSLPIIFDGETSRSVDDIVAEIRKGTPQGAKFLENLISIRSSSMNLERYHR